jgi:hypothetical protein
LIDPS